MLREEWTPWIGIQDIVVYLYKRAHWGALCWLLFLWFAYLEQEHVGGWLPTRSLMWPSVAGGFVVGKLMTWSGDRPMQWAGAVPYVVTTFLIAALISAITLLAHLVNPFEVKGALPWVMLWSTAGVFLRSIPWEGSWRYS